MSREVFDIPLKVSDLWPVRGHIDVQVSHGWHNPTMAFGRPKAVSGAATG